MLQTPFAETPEAVASTEHHTSTVVVAGGAVALALLILDMIAPVAVLPVQLRGLALVVILASAVVGATLWIDRSQLDRHTELLNSRKPGDCCAVAWVEGLAHRPFPGPTAPVAAPRI